MENAVEALKIAFAVMMFILALSLSISSFSMASSTVTDIINMKDRETEYTYVEPSRHLTRTVGIETVVSTIYRAFEENIEIYFVDSTGNPIALYYDTDTSGNLKKDESGDNVEVSSISLAKEGLATQSSAKEHLDIILGGSTALDGKPEKVKEKYNRKFIYTTGLYNHFKNAQFEELLGEYYQGSGASQIKKRIITYKQITL